MNSALISAHDLQHQLGKDTVVFDCRFNLMDKSQGLRDYKQSHILGAYYLDLELDLSSATGPHGGRHPLPDAKELQETLRRAGVYQHSKIVVYDDSRMAYAARAWWLLRYIGHKNVLILDGGFQAWLGVKGALDKREPAVKKGNFTTEIQTNQTCSRDDILQKAELNLIDSREPRRFQGLEEAIDPVAGHIPNAANYPWQEVTNEQGFLRETAWHKSRWVDLKDQPEIVVYCGSGVTACVNLLSLYSAGINAKLYPGSWSDWCSYLPINEKAR